MEYVVGRNDGKRRNISRRSSTVINTDAQGTQHTSSVAENPHLVNGKDYQMVRTDQALCDVELEPNKWVVQVIRKDRIQQSQN